MVLMAARSDDGRSLTFPDLLERFGVSRPTLYRWTKDPKLQFPKPFKINNRSYFRETAIVAWEKARGYDDVDNRALGYPVVSPVITSYEAWCDAMKARKIDLGLTNDEVEIRSGLPQGFLTKLENYGKSKSSRPMGPMTFPLWLGGLRLGVILVDLPRRSYSTKRRREAAEKEAKAC